MTGPVLLSVVAAGAFGTAPPAVPAQDTISYTIIINGHRQGERRMWQEAPGTWRYEHDGDAFHFPRTGSLPCGTGSSGT